MITPKRQGAKFRLDLGQNNGPYLEKDKMPYLAKKIDFLSITDSLNDGKMSISFDFLDDSFNYDEFNGVRRTELEQIENFKSQINYLKQLASVENSKIEDCRTILKETKTDLKKIKEKFEPKAKEENEEIRKMARKFFKSNIQTLMDAEKDELFKFDRQIEQLSHDHKIIGKGLEKASEEIFKQEKYFGIGLSRNNWEERKNEAQYIFRKPKKFN